MQELASSANRPRLPTENRARGSGSQGGLPPWGTDKDVKSKATRVRECSQAGEEQRGTPSVRRLASSEPAAEPSETEAPEASGQGFLDRKPPHVAEDKWKKMNCAEQEAEVSEWMRTDAIGYASLDAYYLHWARGRDPQTRDAGENASVAKAVPLGHGRSTRGSDGRPPRGDAPETQQAPAGGAVAQPVEEDAAGTPPIEERARLPEGQDAQPGWALLNPQAKLAFYWPSEGTTRSDTGHIEMAPADGATLLPANYGTSRYRSQR